LTPSSKITPHAVCALMLLTGVGS